MSNMQSAIATPTPQITPVPLFTSRSLAESVSRRLKYLARDNDDAWNELANSLAKDYGSFPKEHRHFAREAIIKFLLDAPAWAALMFLKDAKLFGIEASRDLDWFLHQLIDRLERGKLDREFVKAWIKLASEKKALRPNVAKRYLPFVEDDEVMTKILNNVINVTPPQPSTSVPARVHGFRELGWLLRSPRRQEKGK